MATMRDNERKEADKRRVDEREEAARVREDDRKETARARADDHNKRALDQTAAISLIFSIATGYFTMSTEVNGIKRRRLHENREAGAD